MARLTRTGLSVICACATLLAGTSSASALTLPVVNVAAATWSQNQLALGDNGTADIAYQDAGGSVHACQLPAGATACTHDSVLGTGSSPAAVIPNPAIPSNDSVVFVSGESELVASSTDEGATYSAPVGAGKGLSQIQLVTSGPGEFDFSALDGGDFLSAALDGSSTPTSSQLEPSAGTALGIGFPDSTTPMAVWSHTDEPSGTNTIAWRRWTDTGDVNDPSTWGPFEEYTPPDGLFSTGPERNDSLASGPKGVFALYYPNQAGGGPCGAVPQVVRYDATTDSWGAPVPVDSDPHTGLSDCLGYGGGGAGEPLAIAEDGSGVIHVIYEFNSGLPSSDQSTPQGIVYTVSFDGGQTFRPPVSVLADPNDMVFPHLAVNDSGAASFAWQTINSNGVELQAMSLPPLSYFTSTAPSSPGGGVCQSVVQSGPMKALATQGCWTQSGSTYTESGPVKLNGIDMTPGGGAGARARAAGVSSLSIDTATDAIKSAGDWDEKVGAVDLGDNPVDWQVARHGGQLIDAATKDPVMFAVSKGQELLGLPVLGTVTPSLSQGVSSIPVNLQLPAPLAGVAGGGLTDDIDLAADDEQGLSLAPGSVQIKLPEVDIGPAKIDPFSITYDADPFQFDGDLGGELPGRARADGGFGDPGREAG